MKKPLVIACIMAIGFGVAAFALPNGISGNWFTLAQLGLPGAGALNMDMFYTSLALTYETCGWTFGSLSEFGYWPAVGVFPAQDGWVNQMFTAQGSVGAFSGCSLLWFDVQSSAFNRWVSGAQVSIAGATLYGFFNVQRWVPIVIWRCVPDVGCWGYFPTVGSGWLVGATGVAGACTLRAEAYFNLTHSLIGDPINWNDYTYEDICNGLTARAYNNDNFHGCFSVYIVEDAFQIVQTNCCVCWTGFDLMGQFPFACVDTVTVYAQFTCLNGFEWLRMELDDIVLDVCCDWLIIDDFNIVWTAQSKQIATIDLDLVVGGVCLTPYFAFDAQEDPWENSGWSIDTIDLYALGLTYDWNGCTFNWITLLDTVNHALNWTGVPVVSGLYTFPGGVLGTFDCVTPYDEMFSIVCDADACCGGLFGFELYNWFDIGNIGGNINPTLFGWAETDLYVSISIGSNLTLGWRVDVAHFGFQRAELSFDVSI